MSCRSVLALVYISTKIFKTIIDWGWARYEELSSPTFVLSTRSYRLRLITQTEALIIFHNMRKPIFVLSKDKKIFAKENLSFFFLVSKPFVAFFNSLYFKFSFPRPNAAPYCFARVCTFRIRISIAWRHNVECDFFISALWRTPFSINVKTPHLVSYWVDMTISQLVISRAEIMNSFN